jgi:transcriptional regulator with XRE-family HTH domain
MASLPPSSFASLLRRYRKAAGLTQEELAERARLSVQAIGALERGDRRAPRRETVDRLAEALALTEPERTLFAATARQRLPVEPPPTALGGGSKPLDIPPLAPTVAGDVPQNVGQQLQTWSIPQPDTARRQLHTRGASCLAAWSTC